METKITTIELDLSKTYSAKEIETFYDESLYQQEEESPLFDIVISGEKNNKKLFVLLKQLFEYDVDSIARIKNLEILYEYNTKEENKQMKLNELQNMSYMAQAEQIRKKATTRIGDIYEIDLDIVPSLFKTDRVLFGMIINEFSFGEIIVVHGDIDTKENIGCLIMFFKKYNNITYSEK